MSRVRGLFCVLFCFIFFPEISEGIPSNQELESKWGFSPLKPELRHRFEGAKLSSNNQKLDIRIWYEDSSVTKNAKPGSNIFCRIAHAMIFGRSKLRSKTESFPIAETFSSIRELSSIEMTFFAVVYRNRPNAPNAVFAGPKEKRPRVIWTREEQIVPYLSLTITRGEWDSIKSILRNQKNIGFETFKDNLCEPILKLTQNLKANFLALSPQPENPTINLTTDSD